MAWRTGRQGPTQPRASLKLRSGQNPVGTDLLIIKYNRWAVGEMILKNNSFEKGLHTLL